MVNLNHERNFVSVATRDAAEDAESRTYRVTATFDGELHDIFTVEINWVLREGSTRGVFDTLVNWENGNVTSVGETTCAVEALQVGQNAVAAIGGAECVLNPVSARQVDLLFFDFRGIEAQEGLRIGTEKFLDFAVLAHGKKCAYSLGRPSTKGGFKPKSSSHNLKTLIKCHQGAPR